MTVKMIKEEGMGSKSILKSLLQHGRAPDYMNVQGYNRSKRYKTSKVFPLNEVKTEQKCIVSTPTVCDSSNTVTICYNNVDNSEDSEAGKEYRTMIELIFEREEKSSESTDPTVRFGRVPKNEKERIRAAMEKALLPPPQPTLELSQYSNEYIVEIITKSHVQSCQASHDDIHEIVRRAEQLCENMDFNPLTSCPMNPSSDSKDYNTTYSPIVREVVTFAKNIPGFSEIRHEDKVTLLRSCVFEVLLIRFACLIDVKNRRMFTISGFIVYAAVYANMKASTEFIDKLFVFIDRINSLHLDDQESALFTAAIVINNRCHGLFDPPKISCLRNRITHCFEMVMLRHRPNSPHLSKELLASQHEMWTLNNMHSHQAAALKEMINLTADSATTTVDLSMNGHRTEVLSNSLQSYTDFADMQNVPMRYDVSPSPEYDDKRMTIDEGLPTSPTSTFCQEDEMRSPGSADSGCSTDSGCSVESVCSSDSGCPQINGHTNEHSSRSHGLHLEEHKKLIPTHEDEETSERFRQFAIKRKPCTHIDELRMDTEKSRTTTWHKPQKESQKSADSPFLRHCLEAPAILKMNSFKDYYRGHRPAHPHKKFRPAQDRLALSHESLESSTSSPRPSTTPSPSFTCSVSPSSSISSSPSRVSSSPYTSSSSNPSSPANVSILANRLAMPIKKSLKTSTLLQSLTQESKFGSSKALLSDALHDCMMNGQTKISRHHVMAAPSPSRYDDMRNASPRHSQSSLVSSPSHAMDTSPPPFSHSNGYSSPPLMSGGYIPHAHSPPSHTPTGLGASGMSGCSTPRRSYLCDDTQPLNLSIKTPPPAVHA